VQEAERLMAESRRLGSGARPDPLAALQAAEQAEAIADQVLLDLKQREEEEERIRQQARSNLQTAESAYARARDYVMSPRGAGVEVRTRLREAERRLQTARDLLERDPRTSVQESQAATREAEEGGGFPGTSRGPGGLGGLGDILMGGLGGLARGGGGGGFPIPRPKTGSSGTGRSRGGSFRSGGGRSRGGRW
jgi:hypothetical protein